MLTHPTLDKLQALKFTGMATALALLTALPSTAEVSVLLTDGRVVGAVELGRESGQVHLDTGLVLGSGRYDSRIPNQALVIHLVGGRSGTQGVADFCLQFTQFFAFYAAAVDDLLLGSSAFRIVAVVLDTLAEEFLLGTIEDTAHGLVDVGDSSHNCTGLVLVFL